MLGLTRLEAEADVDSMRSDGGEGGSLVRLEFLRCSNGDVMFLVCPTDVLFGNNRETAYARNRGGHSVSARTVSLAMVCEREPQFSAGASSLSSLQMLIATVIGVGTWHSSL